VPDGAGEVHRRSLALEVPSFPPGALIYPLLGTKIELRAECFLKLNLKKVNLFPQ
jgi:hypothetical protein